MLKQSAWRCGGMPWVWEEEPGLSLRKSGKASPLDLKAAVRVGVGD